MRNFCKSTFILCLAFVIFSCSSTDGYLDFPVSQGHLDFVSSSQTQSVCSHSAQRNWTCKDITVKNEIPKGNNWQGNWLFTVTSKNRHLEQGAVIAKADLNQQSGQFRVGESIDPNSIPPDQIVYAGFTKLEEGPKGFDIITNDFNRKFTLQKLKVNDNNLSWELKSNGDHPLFTVPMEFQTKAKYQKSEDKLKGKTEFGMNFKVTKQGEESTQYVKIGDYIWEASRISDEMFKNLSKQNSLIQSFPLYFVGIDIDEAKI